MFICASCKKATGPRISPIFKVSASRPKTYLNHKEDEDGIMTSVESSGTETVREVKLCPNCSGIKAKEDVTPDFRAEVSSASFRHIHAKGCNGRTKKKTHDGEVFEEDCKVCLKNISWFGGLSLPALNAALRDKATPEARFSVARVAVERLIERTMHESKRAKADVLVSLGVLKGYEESGGSL